MKYRDLYQLVCSWDGTLAGDVRRAAPFGGMTPAPLGRPEVRAPGGHDDG